MMFLLDTNLLTRAAQPHHPMHAPADASVKLLLNAGETGCIVPQNLYEFWVVSTRPVAQNGLGMSVSVAEAEISKIRGIFKLLDDNAAILFEWEKLVVKYQVAGKNGHDARLVAAMIVHGLTKLLTFNKSDFSRYNEIVAVTPDEVVNAAKAP